MSTILIESVYRELKPLFCLSEDEEDDHRFKLYLDVLYKLYMNKSLNLLMKKDNLNLYLFTDYDEFTEKYYLNNDSDKIYSFEWCIFYRDFKYRISNVEKDKTKLTKIINLVKQYYNISTYGTKEDFIQELIKAHIYIKKTPGTGVVEDITNNINEWNNVSLISYKTTNNIELTVTNDSLIPDRIGIGSGISSDKFSLLTDDYKINLIFKYLECNLTSLHTDLSDDRYFNFKLSKYVLKNMLEKTKEQITTDPYFDEDKQKDEEMYIRDEKGLHYIDTNNNKVYVDDKDDEIVKKVYEDKCLGTRVKENGRLTCADYLKNCVIKGTTSDIKICKNFMLSENFWPEVKEELKTMLPVVMTNTLNMFQFETTTDTDGIKKYKDIGEWIKKIQKMPDSDLTDNDKKKIIENTKLKTYLQALLTKVNSNPAILNPDHRNISTSDNSNNNTIFGKYGLQLRIIYDDNYLSTIRQINQFKDNMLNMRDAINYRIGYNPNGVLLWKGSPVENILSFFQTPLYPKVQYGGSIGGSQPVIYRYYQSPDNYENQLQKQSGHIEKLINALKSGLNSKGYALSPNTIQQIESFYKSYRDTENKLFEIINYTDRYIDLIHIHAKNDKNKNVLTIDNIKKFVDERDKTFDKTSGKQTTLLGLMQDMIEKAVKNAVPSTATTA